MRIAVRMTVLIALLAGPATAQAAFTASKSGNTVVIAGSDLAETLTILTESGALSHGRASAGDPGFHSDLDWDTSVAGTQMAPADDTISVLASLGGGADRFDAPTTGAASIVVDGQAGDDTLGGSPDPDDVRGGPGHDRLAPGAGPDLLAGGGDDDLMVWNSGDGSDDADGGAGFDVLAVNGANVGETFVVKPGSPVRLDRVAPAPFGLDFTAEELQLRTIGGDDHVTAEGAPATSLVVDGGAGADTLTGAAGADTLFGGSGNDGLTGGGGADLLDGGEGDDVLSARDGASDLVRCGIGTDQATLDAAAVDVASECESVDQTPTAPPAPPAPPPPSVVTVTRTFPQLAVAAGQRPRVRRGRVAISARCPAGADRCKGTVELATRSRVRIGRARVIAALGSVAYDVAPGAAATLRIRLPSGYRSLASRRARTLRATATVRGEGGASRRVVVSIRL